jgi:hypothetical protein
MHLVEPPCDATKDDGVGGDVEDQDAAVGALGLKPGGRPVKTGTACIAAHIQI